MQRRRFVRNLSSSLVFLAHGGLLANVFSEKKVKFRFAVASDGHYGEAKTSSAENYRNLVEALNTFHKGDALDACVLNGDLIHNDPGFLPLAAAELQGLQPPFYVTRGNHDRIAADAWEHTWKMPLNHSVVLRDQVFLFGDTSNEKGEYLPPDQAFFEKALEEYKSARNIFIFLHITPVKWTEFGVDAQDFQALIRPLANVRAVFNGHDHDQDNVKMLGHIPFLFDGHFGGSWGTDYHGFRIVELLEDDSLRTYMMDPEEKINLMEVRI